MARILVISPTPSHPQDAGNRARIFSLLSGLKAAGHQVHFAFVRAEEGDEAAMANEWDGFYPIPYQRPAVRWLKRKYDGWAERLGVGGVLPYGIDDWYTAEISRRLAGIREQVRPDVVLLEYVFLSKAFESFGPETLKVLDTHDVFGGRHKLYSDRGIRPVFFYTTFRGERRALERADLVLAIQEEEAAYFARLTKRDVVTVGHMAQVSRESGGSEANRLLFIGSANHINIDGLSWFIEKVFPRLRQIVPAIELDVVGRCSEHIPPHEGVNLLGPVAELAPHYRRAAVVINPLRFGTGLKIKTIEALAYGKPLVTTSAGAAGLEEEKGNSLLVADTPEEFSADVLRLLQTSTLAGAVGKKARQYAQLYNKKAIAPLLEAVREGRG
jgi:glycosyltransferase involved in cell wall biosynthesis